MSLIAIEDVVVLAVTELAISGVVDLPIDNDWSGVDLVAPGYYEERAFSSFLGKTFSDGVRIAVEDTVIHIYKFERMGVVAQAEFRGDVSYLVIAAVVKGWI
jgi:hypothetical protein